MRVVRGRAETPEADREATTALLEFTARTGEAGLRVWRPHEQVAVGRRDAASDSYDRVREATREHGYETVERDVGGRAVAHTGRTLAVSYTVADDDPRAGIRSRYRNVTSSLKRALGAVGVRARRGEPEASFCPGRHSLQNGGKIVGVAQRVRREAALVGGYVIVRASDEGEIAAVLEQVYEALGVPFDPGSVGSVEGAGGSDDPETVARAIETAFVDRAADHSVAPVGSLR